MKLLTGWVLSAGLVLAATSANAQAPDEIGHSRYSGGTDGPYAAMPPEGRGAGSGPTLLPAREVYTVVRDNGFSALGSPRQHGDFYTISVTDRRGGEARLVIDARDGQIVRFMRGDRIDANLHGDVTASMSDRGVPRPPASVPHVASRTVPLPKAPPPRPGRDPGEPKPLAATPASEPPQQAAAVETKPAGPSTTAQNPAPAVAVVQAKPAAPQILPTQEMPKVQDLE